MPTSGEGYNQALMKINKAHCFFEQSGTFKKEFIRLGIPAEDYDIKDDFHQTDHIIDLFGEIKSAYKGAQSIFDNIAENDLIIAFFPCVRFESQISLNFRGVTKYMQKWTNEKKLTYIMDLHTELHDLYILLCKLMLICTRRHLRLVVENPSTPPHYLTQYFPIKPAIKDTDRRRNGDYYNKPTQYWFIGCKPECNITMEPIDFVPIKYIKETHNQVERSLIHPQYARRFIIQYLIDCRGGYFDDQASSD